MYMNNINSIMPYKIKSFNQNLGIKNILFIKIIFYSLNIVLIKNRYLNWHLIKFYNFYNFKICIFI